VFKKVTTTVVVIMCSANVIAADPIVTDSTSRSNVESNSRSENVIKSPPPSAISPNINTSNSDLCTVGVVGAVQTQILGISAGATVRDMNCERLKLSKTLYDMGMKVAAISTLCQDKRIFDAMMQAGTPCPYDGMIGADAKAAWKSDEESKKLFEKEDTGNDKTLWGVGGVGALLLLLLL
jgi:hypothetical protein